jgi:hypothetical protein
MRAFLLALVVVGCGLSGCIKTQTQVWQRSWADIRGPFLDYVNKDPALPLNKKDMLIQQVQLLDLTLKDITGE